MVLTKIIASGCTILLKGLREGHMLLAGTPQQQLLQYADVLVCRIIVAVSTAVVVIIVVVAAAVICCMKHTIDFIKNTIMILL